MPSLHRSIPLSAAAFALAAAAACSDGGPASPEPILRDPVEQVARLYCEATVATGRVRCAPTDGSGGPRTDLIGGQGQFLQLASSNVAYNAGTEEFSFDVTVQNLMPEAIGTPDGTVQDPNGIRVAFHTGPTVTGGTGVITVANADGTGTFTGSNQPYFQYDEILSQNEVSGAKTWILSIPATVTTFAFSVVVSTEVQPLLVINELLANPGGTITDASGEWFEIYNAGARAVEMQGFVIADSAASGRRPYHLINSPLSVPAGGYVVLGNTTNTTNNGGVTVDYAYGSAMAFANSLDALKIARVFGTDTLTIDRTQYSSAAISAQNGISRELLNPALDNSNMDGSNWGDALVTAVYGPGGRGTPKAQNSTFTP
jgi:hypothetical protein